MRISDWSSDVCSSDLGVRGMSLKLRERVIEMLSSRPDERFKARDIASWICKNYRAEADEKLTVSKSLKSKTELLNQLDAEIGANRPDRKIVVEGKRESGSVTSGGGQNMKKKKQ